MCIKYREFMSLTEEEIKFIIMDIVQTKKVDNIIKNEKSQTISCDIYIMDEYPDYSDTIDLAIPSYLQ